MLGVGLNIVLFCVLSCAFGSDKYCNTCIKSGKWLFVGKTVQPWISSGAISISRNLMPTRSRAGYTKSRVPFYSNCSATFNIEYLRMCGDISPNPGPKSTRTCTECDRVVAKNHRATKCDGCSMWTHIKCGEMPPKQYRQMKLSGNISHTCRSCFEILKEFPFANTSLNSSNGSSDDSASDKQDIASVWADYDNIIEGNPKNVKTGHLNANSIGGFKFFEIKTWLLSGRFDVLVISETKIDASFPDSHFRVDGYRFCRSDRKAGGGGLIIYVRSDICFVRANQLNGLKFVQDLHRAPFHIMAIFDDVDDMFYAFEQLRMAIKEYFLKKSTEPENPREFWNAYRPFLHSKSKQANDIVLKDNGVVISEKGEIAELFNENFLKVADDVGLISERDYGEVKNLLSAINVRKSRGYDMLSPKLIKESAGIIATPIANILNASINQNCYPSAWKKGQLTPLFKKDDEFSKANYRPVTVLPVLNNIYERLLAAQMDEFCTAILSDYISSYRKCFSCETALLRLTEDWRKMRDNGELVASLQIAMDLSKAFDVIQHDLLLAKLKAYGVEERSCALLRDYLSGRQQRVKIGDTVSAWADVRRGVLQGSVLGPTFFNIFINDLFYHVTQAKLNAYADDHQIYHSDIDPVALEKCVCDEVEVANQWYHNNGMIICLLYKAFILPNFDYCSSYLAYYSEKLAMMHKFNNTAPNEIPMNFNYSSCSTKPIRLLLVVSTCSQSCRHLCTSNHAVSRNVTATTTIIRIDCFLTIVDAVTKALKMAVFSNFTDYFNCASNCLIINLCIQPTSRNMIDLELYRMKMLCRVCCSLARFVETNLLIPVHDANGNKFQKLQKVNIRMGANVDWLPCFYKLTFEVEKRVLAITYKAYFQLQNYRTLSVHVSAHVDQLNKVRFIGWIQHDLIKGGVFELKCHSHILKVIHQQQMMTINNFLVQNCKSFRFHCTISLRHFIYKLSLIGYEHAYKFPKKKTIYIITTLI
ncbi:Hypothetical predicted protein, partial [Paramuricea clavata]